MADVSVKCPAGADTPEGANEVGAFRLTWEGPRDAEFRLVERGVPGDPSVGSVLYQGPQRASTVTGRPEGDYWYAVGVVDDGHVTQWSDPCLVTVRPYPLAVAGAFFAFGLFVTVATVTLVVRGHRAHKRGEIG
jgi:hypothetical protein